MSITFSKGNTVALEEMQVIVAGVTGDLSGYKVTVSEFAPVVTGVGAFAGAQVLAANPATRTSGTIAARDVARDEAERLLKPFMLRIKYDASISRELKLNIGIKPPGTERHPLPPLTEPPVLTVVGATPGSQTLRYAALDGIEGGRKPRGATAIQIHLAVADAPVTDPSATEFYAGFTRNPIPVEFTPADDGKIATYFARWTNAKGQVGPWSAAATMRIAA